MPDATVGRAAVRTLLFLALLLAAALPAQAQLVINEVLYDPAADLPGDANGDGTRDGSDDEFIEIVNTGATAVDISGYTIDDAATTGDPAAARHVFPAGTVLEPGAAVVVFGGGTPTGSFGFATVQLASGGFLGLNNSGDTVYLTMADETTVAEYTYDGAVQDEAVARNPDLTGDFAAHSSIGTNAVLFSPGLQNADGQPFVVPDAPVVSFTASGATADEDSTVTLTVTIDYLDDAPDGNDVTVTIGFDAGASTADSSDFTGPTPATVTFFGDTDNEEQAVTVSLTGEDGFEGDESAVFNLTVTAGEAFVGSPATFAVNITDLDPVEVITIGEARAAGPGATVAVEGTVTRAEGAFTYFEDESGGLAIRQTSGPFFDAVASGALAAGELLRVIGTLSEFNGQLQISGDALESYELLGPGSIVEPAVVSLADIAANGELFESELVLVRDLAIETADEVFEAGTNYAIVDTSDASNAVSLRVPSANDTEVDGLPVPRLLFDFTGVVGQFDSSEPRDSGYQLLAISEGDIETVTVFDIADVRALESDTVVAVAGVVTRARGRSLRIQDSTAGIAVFQASGALVDSIASGGVAQGDRVLVSGTLSEANGLLQISPVDTFIVLERGLALPAAQFVTLGELAADGEAYESELVTVFAGLEDAVATFAANTSYGLTDGFGNEGDVRLSVGDAQDSELDGEPAPDRKFVFTGVVGQFDEAPFDAGYELTLIDVEDLYVPDFVATLGGGQEVQPVATGASGFVGAVVTGERLTLQGSFRGLRSPYDAGIGSHLHIGYAGQNGPVAIALSPELSEDGRSGSFLLDTLDVTAAEREALQGRQMYVNVHTQDFPGGEIRGQLLPASADAYGWYAASGAAEVPFNTSRATGAAAMEVYFAESGDVEVVVTGAFSGLEGAYQASHLHGAAPGQNGDVVQALSATVIDDTSGVYTADDNRYVFSKTALPEDGLYLNVHSAVYPGGEIRGDLLPIGQTFHHAALLPENEVPGIMGSAAAGGAALSVFNGGLTIAASFSGLSSAYQAAHLHIGEAGEAGGVVLPLDFDVAADGLSGTLSADDIQLTDEQYALALEEGLYVNVHSADFPAGELRGQVLLAPNRAPDSTSLTSPADGAVITIAGDGNQPFGVDWDGTTDPDGDRVIYVWQLATADAFGAEDVLLTVNASTEGSFEVTFAQVDSVLALAGVPVGLTVAGYHRVLASDGSVYNPSEVFEVSITRGQITAGEDGPDVPAAFALGGAYPNPTPGASTLRFDLPEPAAVSVEVYDVIGRRVLTLPATPMAAARHRVRLETGRLPSGAYLYRLQAEGASQTFQATGRLTVVR